MVYRCIRTRAAIGVLAVLVYWCIGASARKRLADPNPERYAPQLISISAYACLHEKTLVQSANYI